MNIDRKYKIHAVNPCSGNTHSEYDSILFLAKDKAVPAMLRAYLKESEALGANPAHLESIGLLIGRVEQYQREVEAKTPDTDLPCEIRRCVDGEGVSDNKQDFASGAQPAPSIPEISDDLIEAIESRAEQSYRRHHGGIRGQQVTPADALSWHIIHATRYILATALAQKEKRNEQSNRIHVRRKECDNSTGRS